MPAAGAGLGLRARVAREEAESDRDARVEPGELEPARRLRADVVEVRRLAADDAAERDDVLSSADLAEGDRRELRSEERRVGKECRL